MRRLSKSKKGKANANANEKEASQEGDVQDNGSAIPSDEEDSGNEKRTVAAPKAKRGRRSNVDYKAEEDSDDGVPLSQKSKKARKGRKSNKENGNDSDEEEEKVEAGSEEEDASKVNKSKKSGKGGKDEVDQVETADNEEEEYEVEKVVDCKIYRGVKQYRIRWKGFEEDKDTWEPETDLNCPELIDQFLSQNPDAAKTPAKSEKKSGNDKKRNKSANSAQPKVKQKRVVEPVAGEDEAKEYEVDRVLEVYFKKNGDREFLIRWKGFSPDDDTWEPEANLNCPELIEKFMEKVEKARELSERELRVNRQSTKRFTLNTRETGRRLSGRHQSRQRVTYYDAE